jgi:hypothetical protein
MRQAGAEQVALMVDEYLGLVFQAAEGGGVDNPVAVTLVFATKTRGGFHMPAPA